MRGTSLELFQRAPKAYTKSQQSSMRGGKRVFAGNNGGSSKKKMGVKEIGKKLSAGQRAALDFSEVKGGEDENEKFVPTKEEEEEWDEEVEEEEVSVGPRQKVTSTITPITNKHFPHSLRSSPLPSLRTPLAGSGTPSPTLSPPP